MNSYIDVDPQYDIDTLPNYYYYSKQDLSAFEFFENCSLRLWSKQASRHYLMQQLKENKYNKRVYDCDEADIAIFPLSLQNKCKTQDLDNYLEQVSDYLFNKSSRSCWNKHIPHFIIARYQKIPKKWWKYEQIIIADRTSHSDHYSERLMINISVGYTSLISEYVYKQQTESLPNHIHVTLHTDKNNDKNNDKSLPQIKVENKIAFKDRPYTLFFMGQTDDINHNHFAYKLRRIIMRYIDNTNNEHILIQTASNMSIFEWILCNISSIKSPCSTYHDSYLFIDLLSKSKFNLMFRGDTPCSSRFYDAISLNVINIVISDHFADCLLGYESHAIPYHDMFLWIKEKDFVNNPNQAIQNVINKYDETHFEYMLNVIDKYKPYILWDAYNSKTAHFALQQALIAYNNHHKAKPNHDQKMNKYQTLCSPLTYPRSLFTSFDLNLSNHTPMNSIYDKFLYYNSISSVFAAQSVVSSHSAHLITVYILPYIGIRPRIKAKRIAFDLYNNMNNVWNKQYICAFYMFDGDHDDNTQTFVVLSDPIKHSNGSTHDIHLNIICNISNIKYQSLRDAILSTSQTTNVGLRIFNDINILKSSIDWYMNPTYYDLLLPICSTIITQNILPLNTENDWHKLSILRTDYTETEALILRKYNYSICTIFHSKHSTQFKDEKQIEYLLQEWIEYHIINGFDHIYIYHHLWNDNQNDYKMNNSIVELIISFNEKYNRNMITYIPWYIGFLHAASIRWFQKSQMMDCLTRFQSKSEWILYIDIDEFVIPKENRKISHLFQDIISNKMIGDLNKNSYYISIPRYNNHIDNDDIINYNYNSTCDIRYDTYMERQSCVIKGFKLNQAKSLIKSSDIYDMKDVHKPWIAVQSKQLIPIWAKTLFILHVADHIASNEKTIIDDGSILYVNQSLCNQSNQTLYVKKAIQNFHKLSIMHHSPGVVPALIHLKHAQYCYKIKGNA